MEFESWKKRDYLIQSLAIMNGDPQDGLPQSSFCATLFSALNDTLNSGTSESLFSATIKFLSIGIVQRWISCHCPNAA